MLSLPELSLGLHNVALGCILVRVALVRIDLCLQMVCQLLQIEWEQIISLADILHLEVDDIFGRDHAIAVHVV